MGFTSTTMPGAGGGGKGGLQGLAGGREGNRGPHFSPAATVTVLQWQGFAWAGMGG